jgi:lactate permease
MPWSQNYDPLHNLLLSTLAAVFPAVLLLASLGIFHIKAHIAALSGLGATLLVALVIYHMPLTTAVASTIYGLAYGILPVGWIIINVLYLHRLVENKGMYTILRANLVNITQDCRLQLLLVAFCFGALLEGTSGFGTPVAVCASILVGLGFPPITASSLSLIANTVPVPFASVGTPLVALQAVTGLDIRHLSIQVASQLSFFSLLIPFWLISVYGGLKAVRGIWPALLVAGGSFTLAQLAITFLHGPWLVSIIAALFSLGCLVLFLKLWKPKEIWQTTVSIEKDHPVSIEKIPAVHQGIDPGKEAGWISSQYPSLLGRIKLAVRQPAFLAWMPWLVLSLLVFLWGLPFIKNLLDSLTSTHIPIPFLNKMVLRLPPVTSIPTPLAAVFDLTWLSASGTAILAAAIISGLWLGYQPQDLLKQYAATLKKSRIALLTISIMMAIGFVIRFAGIDGTLGLAFAQTGWLFPFLSAFLGWFGVVITGSDTSSNVLFGSLQRITAEKLGLDPYVIASANSSGGVMGKMINAQSLVVASTATNLAGQEGDILHRVFWHSIILTSLVGIIVIIQAYLR